MRTCSAHALVLLVIALGLTGCGKPDLQMERAYLSGGPFYSTGDDPGKDLHMYVCNRGTAPAVGSEGTTSDNFYKIDLVLSSDRTASVKSLHSVPVPYVFTEDMLLKGGRVSVTQTIAPNDTLYYPPSPSVSCVLPRGCPDTVYLIAILDPGDQLAEEDETNNLSYPMEIITIGK